MTAPVARHAVVRLLAWPLALLLAAGAAAEPRRVASINLCTDVLLHELAPPERIASLSHLAVDPLVSHYREAMAAYPLNHGHAEELLVMAPDLVLASGHSPTPTLRLLRRQGVAVAVIPAPRDIAGLPAMYREAGRILGRPRQGERLAEAFARLAATTPPAPADAPLAVVFQANGLSYGAGTLADDVLRAAGLRNLAAAAGLEGAGYLALEELLHGRPDIIVLGADHGRWPSQGQALLEHPALERYGATAAAPRLISLPEEYWACPGLYLLEAVARLRRAAAG